MSAPSEDVRRVACGVFYALLRGERPVVSIAPCPCGKCGDHSAAFTALLVCEAAEALLNANPARRPPVRLVAEILPGGEFLIEPLV